MAKKWPLLIEMEERGISYGRKLELALDKQGLPRRRWMTGGYSEYETPDVAYGNLGVTQFLEVKEEDLLSIMNFGQKGLNEIKDSLAAHGLFFKSSLITREEAQELSESLRLKMESIQKQILHFERFLDDGSESIPRFVK